MFRKSLSVTNVLSQVLTMIVLCMSYHMATLTMQYYKGMGEMKDETLSCPLKDYKFYLLSASGGGGGGGGDGGESHCENKY